MAWTTPMTAVSGSGLTAAHWNASVRDNLLETGPAKIAQAGEYLVGTDAHTLAARRVRNNTVATSETETSTSYTDLATAGPEITMDTTDQALIFFASQQANSTTSVEALTSFQISGATSLAAADARSTIHSSHATNEFERAGLTVLATTTAGSNVFTMKYRVNNNTGTWLNRNLIVMGF